MLKDKPEELLDEALDVDELDSAAGGAGSNSEVTAVEGTVIAALPNAMFSVDVGGQTITVHVSGKLRQNYFRILPGDKVWVEGNRITGASR